MLTGNTSNTSRHSETRQSQAGRSPGLARHLFGLPQDIASKIWSFIPSEKTTLASDVFEKRWNAKQNLDRDLQLLLLNRSILPEEREAFLLKALTQANRSKAQSDFSSLLRPVFKKEHPAPYLPRLLEVAACANKSIAFERVIKTALETDTPLPESTYEWVAECGKPEMLNELLVKFQPDLSETRKVELKNLAQAQKESIQTYNELKLPERKKALEDAVQGTSQRTALENRRDVLALLQTPGIDVNVTNRKGTTSLYRAAGCGQTAVVTALLGAPGINVNEANRLGDTALHYAAQNGRTETLKTLLAAPGVDVNAANLLGYTPLHRAAENGGIETVNALLQAPGINVNAARGTGDTALHLAAFQGHTEAVNALLQAPGINVNATNDWGDTSLHFAAHYGHTEIVNALLGAPGIDVNTVDNNSSTPLQLAAFEGHTEAVNALLQAPGINVNAARGTGDTALHLAAAGGHIEIVNALLQAPGINVNAANQFGDTALKVAAQRGLAEIANALWQAGGI